MTILPNSITPYDRNAPGATSVPATSMHALDQARDIIYSSFLDGSLMKMMLMTTLATRAPVKRIQGNVRLAL